MSALLERTFDLYIGGRETSGAAGEHQTLLDPATNHPLATTAIAGVEDAAHAMEVAQQAFEGSGWGADDGARRAKTLLRMAMRLEERLDEFARLETLNMGKTLKESRGDVAYVVRSLEYVAGLADKIQGETIPVPGTRFDYTIREPLGVTVHIAPWNYPLLLAIRSVAPALAAGNTVVLKPASLTPLTAIEFARLATDCGLPAGVLNVVVGSGRDVGEALVRDARCRSVSFTGSGEVGKRIAELASARVIPVTLELGGKSPVVVFPDADLDRAAKGIAFGIFGNAGQMCWAGSRLIVHASVAPALLERVARIAQGYRLGPGTDDGVDMGPLVSRSHLESVVGFLDEAQHAGATFLAGGGRPESPTLRDGNFLAPTVVGGAPPTSRIVRDEVFGPVLVTLPFEDAEEAIRLANDTRYGLFASVWTRDLAVAHSVSRRLEAGMVCINEAPNSYPQSPFGGYKESGIGFEQGIDAVRLYTRRKNVIVNYGAPRPKK